MKRKAYDEEVTKTGTCWRPASPLNKPNNTLLLKHSIRKSPCWVVDGKVSLLWVAEKFLPGM